MTNSTKEFKALSPAETGMVRRQLAPSIVLAIGLVMIITLVNLALQYMDVITGVKGIGRPPFSRFLIIESIAILLGVFTFLYLTRAVRKDLTQGKKIIEEVHVKRKFAKRENGTLNLKILVTSNLTLDVIPALYNSLSEGDKVIVERAPLSEIVFDVRSSILE